MELKAGYKKTEVGIIPEDWKVASIEYVSKPKGIVRGPFGGALKKSFFVKEGFKVYEQKNAIYQSVNLGRYFVDDKKFQELKRFSVNKGDFIISCSGTIGKIFQIPKEFKKGIINQALLKLTLDNNLINSNYFYYQFTDDKFQSKVIDDTQGGAMKNLVGISKFKKTLFPLPPLPEQKAIATVLSDTDNLIQALEKKIAKKQLIKKGAMQKLLSPTDPTTGKIKDGWEVKRLGDICEIRKGQLITSSTKIDGEIPVIAGGKIPAYYHKYSNRKGKTITISASGANAGYVAFYKKPIFASDCSTISENKNYSIEFIYFFLQNVQSNIYKSQTGGAQPHIHPNDLKPIEIPFFLLDKQTRIAKILSDMDSEIETLEKKLKKYKQIKQGLMQVLLTGKIRLV